MKIAEELLKHVRNWKYFPEVAFTKNKSTITDDSLLSFWDNEYEEAWNEC